MEAGEEKNAELYSTGVEVKIDAIVLYMKKLSEELADSAVIVADGKQRGTPGDVYIGTDEQLDAVH